LPIGDEEKPNCDTPGNAGLLGSPNFWERPGYAELQYVQVRRKCSAGRKQACRGKSQNPVAWTAGREETNCLESVDKATVRVVSE